MDIISGEIRFAFRDEINNIFAMTYGRQPKIEFKQIIICKKNKFPANRLGPFLLDSKRSKSTYTPSVIGSQYEKQIEGMKFELKYIAFIDEQIEIKPSLALFKALKEAGLFCLWEPKAPYYYFGGQEKGYLIVFRVYQLEQSVDETLLEKGRSGRNYYYTLSETVSYTNATPVMRDEEFEMLKKQIIQLANKYNKYDETQMEQYLDKVNDPQVIYEAEQTSKTHNVETSQYDRDQRISTVVKKRANGYCECCHQAAPFIKENAEPYLEEHHLLPLSEGGRDILDNVCAVCPNCHRELHYGVNRNKLREKIRVHLTHKRD